MKSIIFNDEMVRAVLSGKKTVTRRPIKNFSECSTIAKNKPYIWVKHKDGPFTTKLASKPFEAGEVFYMRECFSNTYKSGTQTEFTRFRADKNTEPKSMKWIPSINMSEKDSRVRFRITECYAEKLNDIMADQIPLEGVKYLDLVNNIGLPVEPLLERFVKLWDYCYESPYDWKSNPYVWVIKFEVIEDE